MEGSCEECGVRELGDVLRVRRLGWFGHVVREDTEILGKTQHVVEPGRRPPGRPKKTWRRNMQEELASLNLQEEQAQNRDACHQPSHLMKMSLQDVKRKKQVST